MVRYWFPSDEELVQGSGSVIDEPGWINPLQPVTYYIPQQWLYDEQIPAANLTATVDEYYWQAPPLTQYGQQRLLWFDTQDIVPQPAPFVYEEYWFNLTLPLVAPNYQAQQFLFDSGDFAASLQNYVGASGSRNFVTQDIGSGVEF